MRSTPIGGRPFPGFGYTGSTRAPSSRHGTTRSISARNCARRVVFAYFSKPLPPSVSCERPLISTSRSHVMWLVASQHNPRESRSLIQRFLDAPTKHPETIVRSLQAQEGGEGYRSDHRQRDMLQGDRIPRSTCTPLEDHRSTREE